jgi:predicted CXXCH cytochrome family protein
VSCFSASRSGIACHPNGPSNHPFGWSAPGSHGSAAKAASPGLAYCTGCHGSDYKGGAGKSCMTCHTTAPHPAAPWIGTTTTGTTHTTTNEANVAECARCHLNNARLTTPVAVPPGTTPGCFNNTLCHGPKSGHPVGWSAPASHGGAAKAVPSATQGFLSCTQCHGSDYVSGIGTSCKACHTTAPHPATPWRGTTATGTTHTTTNEGNVSQCARCHLNNARLATPVAVPPGTTPGCFNGTLCHGTPSSGHAFPYGGSLHRPGGTGTVLANIRAPYTNCSGCHDTTTAGGTYPVASGVRPLCSGCHLNMANFTSTTPGCWDCHGASATDGRPNGTSFPNRQGSADGHNRNTHRIACTFCHPITTGSVSHGWSNRVKSSNAQVVTTLNWNPGSRAAGTGTCNPSTGGNTGCHGSKTGWY